MGRFFCGRRAAPNLIQVNPTPLPALLCERQLGVVPKIGGRLHRGQITGASKVRYVASRSNAEVDLK